MATTAKIVKEEKPPKLKVRLRNRCKLCGRPRGVLRKFVVCSGNVVGVQQVVESDNLMLITDTGRIIRLAIADLRVIGRNTQGVKVFEINGGEKVAGVALVVEDTENSSVENE